LYSEQQGYLGGGHETVSARRSLLPYASGGFHRLKNIGNRLSKIATRTGDDGTTGLGDGSRTDKHALRVQAMGDVDELNSQLGLLLCEQLPDTLHDELVTIQHDLFDLGGELSIPGFVMMTDGQVARLDALLEKYNATLPPLKEFICRVAHALQLNRTYAVPSADVPSAVLLHWRARKKYMRGSVSMSTVYPICCSFYRAC
jgi:hypothetical protein